MSMKMRVNEAEFDRVLGMVCMAMTEDDGVDLAGHEEFMIVPVAANDNDGPWPLLPFPDGWTASC